MSIRKTECSINYRRKIVIPIADTVGYTQHKVQLGSSLWETNNALYSFCPVQAKGTNPGRTGETEEGYGPQSDVHTWEVFRIGNYGGE